MSTTQDELMRAIARASTDELETVIGVLVTILLVRGISPAECRFMIETQIAKAGGYQIRG